MAAELTRTYDERDIRRFTAVTGDLNPAPVDQAFAEPTVCKGRIAHGMLTANLVSAVLGTKLPGPGSVYLTQSLKFLGPVRAGDTATAPVAVIDIVTDENLVTPQTTCANQKGERLLEGTALVMPPRVKSRGARDERVIREGSRSLPTRRPRLALVTGRRPRREAFLVGQRMTPDPVTVSPETTLSRARALMDRHRLRLLPVVEGGALVGMVAESDIRRGSRRAWSGSRGRETATLLPLIRVRDAMVREVVTISPAAAIGEASALLVSRKFEGLPVVEDGRLVGILTVIDALEAMVALVGA
jgi:3-hydroxybutyryl-CoA dehydratase